MILRKIFRGNKGREHVVDQTRQRCVWSSRYSGGSEGIDKATTRKEDVKRKQIWKHPNRKKTAKKTEEDLKGPSSNGYEQDYRKKKC